MEPEVNLQTEKKYKYLSRQVGVYIPIPEALLKKGIRNEEDGYAMEGIKFRSDKHGIFETDSDDLKDIIEGNDKKKMEPSKKFKQGVIVRLPTNIQLKLEAQLREEEILKALNHLGVKLPDGRTSDDKLASFAKIVGVPIYKPESGEKLTKTEILSAIYDNYGLTYKEENIDEK